MLQNILTTIFGTKSDRDTKALLPIVDEVNTIYESLKIKSDEELVNKTLQFKEEIIGKYNFYQKRYKKINKLINLIVKDNIIYANDNIGFIYAYDYNAQKILWAKNYKTPFRSNIKI